MNAIKTYTEGSVTYGYSRKSRKWEFFISSVAFTYLCQCPRSLFDAQKVARIIAGSVKRCGALDNLGRANIKALINPRSKYQEPIVY